MKSEILGVVVVESGWGSMVPTVVIANLSPYGAAAKCGQLNIGDQIIAINGVSLVGLPLSTCQNYIKVSGFRDGQLFGSQPFKSWQA
jgi:predicted aconitase with swiveling domain